jgi:hypothetical protein
MTVPIPLILAAKIATPQKVLLCILFSSGIFVMVAACLRAYYSVKDINTLSTALGWASREALVSVIIVCAPGIKPLFNQWGLFRSYGSSRGHKYNYNNTKTAKSKSRGTFFNSRTGEDGNVGVDEAGERHPYELSNLAWRKKRQNSSGESQECIIGADGRDEILNKGITVTTDVTLAHDDTGPEGNP